MDEVSWEGLFVIVCKKLVNDYNRFKKISAYSYLAVAILVT